MISRFLTKIATLGVVFCILAPISANAANPETTSREPSNVASEVQGLGELYLSIVEDAVDFFEPLWKVDSRIQNAGFFDFRLYGNWINESCNYSPIIIIPGNGMVLLAYAVLLTETDKHTFGKSGLPRETLLDRVNKAIRWCCLTSVYVEDPFPYLPNTPADLLSGKHWQRRIGRRVDLLGYMTLAAAILWDRIPPETKSLFRAVAIGGAQRSRVLRTWELGQGGNHDRVKQDLSSTFGAAFLFGNDGDGGLFRSAIIADAIDMVSTLQDRTKQVPSEGKLVKEWSEGWNLYEDYSSDHHRHANIWYGGDMLFEGRSYIDILAHVTKKEVPETFTYQGNGFDGVLEWLKILCLAEGGLVHPHGAEYDSYYGAGLLGFCYGATVKKDRVAAALERQSAKLLFKHSRAVQQYDYHRGSWAKAALAYLMHKYNTPAAVPIELGQALRSAYGTYYYRDQQCFIHRTPEKWVSYSWGSKSAKKRGVGLCGIVVPQSTTEQSDEPFVYSHPHSLTGTLRSASPSGGMTEEILDVSYKFYRSDNKFTTTGRITHKDVQRYHAFMSFGKGPIISFTAIETQQDATVTWSGLPIYFYVRPGITTERSCYYENGNSSIKAVGEKRSAWWCVNNKLGMAIVGEPVRIRGGNTIGYNWARTDSYKDKCDFIAVSPLDQFKMKAGETIHVSAAIYVNHSHDEVRNFSKAMQDLTGQLPKRWKGVIAPLAGLGGERLFAISNFSGHTDVTELHIKFPQGAPVLEKNTMIVKDGAVARIQLSSLETRGEILDWYVEVLRGEGLHARKIAFDHIELIPFGREDCDIRIRYSGKNGDRIVFKNTANDVLKSEPAANAKYPDGLEWNLTDRLVLQIHGKKIDDHTGPAVEIQKIKPQDKGKINIRVTANDRSGIQSVKLYCDDHVVGHDSIPPFEWTYQAKPGWHTFRAIATDASTNQNVSRSFSRTILIENQ